MTKLKATFDRYLEKFRTIQEEYDQYTTLDQKSADDKIRLMKNKIEQYEVRLADKDVVDVIDKHAKLSQTEESRAFAEFKASVEVLKQELAITKARHAIELDDLRKQADTLESEKISSLGLQREAELCNEKSKDANAKVNR